MDAVLVAQGLTKSYRMGEVEVPALRGIENVAFVTDLAASSSAQPLRIGAVATQILLVERARDRDQSGRLER